MPTPIPFRYAALDTPARRRHLDAEGAPLLDVVRPGDVCLLDLACGPTPDTSPGVAVEIHVRQEDVVVVLWLFREPFRVVSVAGQA